MHGDTAKSKHDPMQPIPFTPMLLPEQFVEEVDPAAGVVKPPVQSVQLSSEVPTEYEPMAHWVQEVPP